MNKNEGLILHIIEHINGIYSAQQRFGNDYEKFTQDKDYFNSVCMNLLQIGELANHLTADFISNHADILWKNIIGLRNVVVHGYGQLDMESVWATLTDDIPDLHEKCKAIIKNEFSSDP